MGIFIRRWRRRVLGGTLAVLAVAAHANVELAPVYGDHAVIQRDRPVPVWGTAEPGEQVSVAFRGSSATVVAGKNGRWMATIGPFSASGEGAPLVVEGKNRVRLDDVVVGDVWLCSGQSNMELPVSMALDAKKEIAAAHYPLVRQIRFRHVPTPMPLTRPPNTGWLSAEPKSVGDFSAVAYFFAREMSGRLNIPIGIVQSTYGGTPIEAWISPEALAKDPAYPAVDARQKGATAVPFTVRKARYDEACAEWEKGERMAAAAGPAAHDRYLKEHGKPPSPLWPQCESSALFNAMIDPIVPCALRGVLWYQGESNADHPAEYRSLFQTLITSWRGYFRDSELPFYWVQLPDFETNEPWAKLREAQSEALVLPHTAQAVAIDVGDPHNIHPRNKQAVGHRLALIVRAKLFSEAVEWSGPLFESVEREGSALRVHFSHAKGLAAESGQVGALEIAGSDRHFHPAAGRIEGESIVISSPEVAEPVAVRYAFQSAPHANLYNAAGLPACPFRTDTW